MPEHTNRLAAEQSPYLLQHAHNPVDWFAWGDEAFEKARAEQKPIFLSVGYSTCHWCHVMEHESFESEAVAEILNKYFVSIKVDREERPDIDRVYMTYVQATTGSGGWPMSVWLTPELKPFVGGTYFPPDDRYGRPGFKNILTRIVDAWNDDREKILSQAESVTLKLQAYAASADDAVSLGDETLQQGYSLFARMYDPQYGGFGAAPKFPRPVCLNFLFAYFHRTGAKAAKDMALHTLRKMADGGMHDHIGITGKGGGGFARYSTDAQWHVPHFEKMLYDNAQLAASYLDAYQLTHDGFYSDVARDIFNYVQCDMTSAEGAFYSAEDADSLPDAASTHKTEGAFYVWEQQELNEILGSEASNIFCSIYGVQESGNAANDPHGEFTNKNILIVRGSTADAAKRFGKSEAEVDTLVAEAKAKLFAVRAQRPRPHLDDKILTAWNALMISAFARGYQILGDQKYLDAATTAAEFILKHLYKNDVLLRRYRSGVAAIEGYLDDYAFFVKALIDLYEASLDPKYFTLAIALTEKQILLFNDERGGFFNTSGKDATVLLRMKEDHDGAEPSPNSVATENLLRLAEMTDRDDFRLLAAKALENASTMLSKSPASMPEMLVALNSYLQKPKQILLAGEKGSAEMAALLGVIHQSYLPDKIILHASDEAAKHLPFLASLKPLDDKPTAFVCIDYACNLPTNEPAGLQQILFP
ncbi:MAG: thioredoxin domain-containing protein [Rhizobacter sp.]|nr:thioredoxin domain-containing protein [Chlorobiales bacterium]